VRCVHFAFRVRTITFFATPVIGCTGHTPVRLKSFFTYNNPLNKKGNSLEEQEDRLIKHCELNGIKIKNILVLLQTQVIVFH
jgi:hypothetical protein